MWGLFPSPLNILIPGGAKQICARPPNRGRAWVTGLLSVTGQKRIPGGVNAHRAAKTLAWDEAAFPFQHNKPRQATTASGPCSDQGVSRESEAPSRALPAPTPLHDRSVSSCALPGSCGSISRPEVGKREASAKGPAGPAGLARAGQGRKGRAGSGEERSGAERSGPRGRGGWQSGDQGRRAGARGWLGRKGRGTRAAPAGRPGWLRRPARPGAPCKRARPCRGLSLPLPAACVRARVHSPRLALAVRVRPRSGPGAPRAAAAGRERAERRAERRPRGRARRAQVRARPGGAGVRRGGSPRRGARAARGAGPALKGPRPLSGARLGGPGRVLSPEGARQVPQKCGGPRVFPMFASERWELLSLATALPAAAGSEVPQRRARGAAEARHVPPGMAGLTPLEPRSWASGPLETARLGQPPPKFPEPSHGSRERCMHPPPNAPRTPADAGGGATLR